MHAKPEPRGIPGATVRYIMDQGRKRPDHRLPLIILGNAKRFQRLLRTGRFHNKVTAITLTWEEEIEDDVARKHTEDCIAILLPEVDSSEICVVAARHKEKRRGHPGSRTAVHLLIENVNLRTGRRIQPYYAPVDNTLLRAWEHKVNILHGYSSPADPDRQRTTNFDRRRISQKTRAYLEEVDSELRAADIAGLDLNSRDSVRKWLEGRNGVEAVRFYVDRYDRQSISVRDRNITDKKGKIVPVRLRGALYERSNPSRAKGHYPVRAQATYDRSPSAFRRMEELLAEEMGKKADYLKKALKKVPIAPTPPHDPQSSLGGAIRRCLESYRVLVDAENRDRSRKRPVPDSSARPTGATSGKKPGLGDSGDPANARPSGSTANLPLGLESRLTAHVSNGGRPDVRDMEQSAPGSTRRRLVAQYDRTDYRPSGEITTLPKSLPAEIQLLWTDELKPLPTINDVPEVDGP